MRQLDVQNGDKSMKISIILIMFASLINPYMD
jgi:hypothetical protein